MSALRDDVALEPDRAVSSRSGLTYDDLTPEERESLTPEQRRRLLYAALADYFEPYRQCDPERCVCRPRRAHRHGDTKENPKIPL